MATWGAEFGMKCAGEEVKRVAFTLETLGTETLNKES